METPLESVLEINVVESVFHNLWLAQFFIGKGSTQMISMKMDTINCTNNVLIMYSHIYSKLTWQLNLLMSVVMMSSDLSETCKWSLFLTSLRYLTNVSGNSGYAKGGQTSCSSDWNSFNFAQLIFR